MVGILLHSITSLNCGLNGVGFEYE